MSDAVKSATILVVDDDPTILDLIGMALSFEGFACIGARNGELGLERVEESNPALVLLDVSMPVMDGREFYRRLRADGHREVPVVVMTAGQHAEKTCAELGAQDYLTKPFNLDDLLACVEKWTGH